MTDPSLFSDKRQNKRFKVNKSGGLMGIMDDEFLVDIVDMSVGGIALKAERRLAIGREYTMHLHDQGKRIDVQGTIIRSRIVDKNQMYNGRKAPVYAAALKLREGLEDRVADFICEALLV